MYFSENIRESEKLLSLTNEEAKHCSQVMRNKTGDEIAVTDGKGKIFLTKIIKTEKREVTCQITNTFRYENPGEKIIFVIPRLRNSDRMEFALEKCTELGITNFIVYQADKSIGKGDKSERWNKILLSAMKQSLRAYKPSLRYIKNLSGLELEEEDIVLFADQSAEQGIEGTALSIKGKNFFIFGPEGGFSERESQMFENCLKYRLTGNRLRSETAIMATAAQIGIKLNL